MGWVFLAGGVFLEVLGTTCLKLSEGFTRLWPTIGMMVFYSGGLGMLTLSIKTIEIGVAYAVWAGLGTALIALIGIALFQESVSALKMGSLALVILGVVGLSISGAGH